MPQPSTLDLSDSVLLLRALGFPGGTVRRPPLAGGAAVGRRVRDLHIGLDLGTSCSKVVIGDPEGGRSFPVRFDVGGEGIARYLLPTRIEFDSETARLGGPRSERSVDDLKWRAMCAAFSGDARDRATEDLTIYLALVLRSTLAWFEQAISLQYSDSDIAWHLNIGFPDKHVVGPLLSLYERASRTAVAMMEGNEGITQDRAAAMLLRHGTITGVDLRIPPERVHFYPEIAAQLAGYVKSRYRRQGNLLFVDVGAGTLDVSTLIVHRVDHAHRCSFHFCSVKPLGAFRLFVERNKLLEQFWPGLSRRFDHFLRDGLLPLPDALDQFLAEGVEAPREMNRDFTALGEDFGQRCRATCLEPLMDFRRSLRSSHSNTGYDPWPTTLPMILTGGGSRMGFFQTHLLKRLEREMVSTTRWHQEEHERRRDGQGLESLRLPVPDDLQSDDPAARDAFDRLSVAHGLACGIDNLMEITGAMRQPSPPAPV